MTLALAEQTYVVLAQPFTWYADFAGIYKRAAGAIGRSPYWVKAEEDGEEGTAVLSSTGGLKYYLASSKEMAEDGIWEIESTCGCNFSFTTRWYRRGEGNKGCVVLKVFNDTSGGLANVTPDYTLRSCLNGLANAVLSVKSVSEVKNKALPVLIEMLQHIGAKDQELKMLQGKIEELESNSATIGQLREELEQAQARAVAAEARLRRHSAITKGHDQEIRAAKVRADSAEALAESRAAVIERRDEELVAAKAKADKAEALAKRRASTIKSGDEELSAAKAVIAAQRSQLEASREELSRLVATCSRRGERVEELMAEKAELEEQISQMDSGLWSMTDQLSGRRRPLPDNEEIITPEKTKIPTMPGEKAGAPPPKLARLSSGTEWV